MMMWLLNDIINSCIRATSQPIQLRAYLVDRIIEFMKVPDIIIIILKVIICQLPKVTYRALT